MTNPEHWNTLASQLGAEIPAEAPAAEPKPAAKPALPPARPARPSEAKKPAPPKANTDWSQLASTLGLTPAESRPPQTPPRAVSPQRETPEFRPRTPPRETPPRDLPPRETPPPRQQRERVVEETFDRFEAADEFDEEPIDAELVEEGEPQATAPGDADEERPVRKRRRRRRGGRRSRRDRPAGEAEARQGADEAIEPADRLDSEALEEPGAEEEGPSAAHAPAEEPDRTGRPRRRRRRGSGRDRDAQRGRREEGPRAEATPADLPDEEQDQDEFESTAGEDLAGNDDGLEGPVDKNSHRAIPAWEEAIGFIVSVNMEARAKNPKSGPPRGRGRGGRGRGNSRGGSPRRS